MAQFGTDYRVRPAALLHRWGTTAAPLGHRPTPVLVIAVDSNGVPLWRRQFGGADQEQGKDVQQLADGRFVLVGGIADRKLCKAIEAKAD